MPRTLVAFPLFVARRTSMMEPIIQSIRLQLTPSVTKEVLVMVFGGRK